MATVEPLGNNIPGKDFRDLINSNLGILNSDKAEVSTVSTLANRVTVTEADIATLQEQVQQASILITTATDVTQTVVPNDVEVKLNCMVNEFKKIGEVYSLADGKISISTIGIHRFSGNLNISAPINDIVVLRMYVDSTSTPYYSTIIGRGIDVPVSVPYTSVLETTLADTEVELRVQSTGSTVKVNTFNFLIEETNY